MVEFIKCSILQRRNLRFDYHFLKVYSYNKSLCFERALFCVFEKDEERNDVSERKDTRRAKKIILGGILRNKHTHTHTNTHTRARVTARSQTQIPQQKNIILLRHPRKHKNACSCSRPGSPDESGGENTKVRAPRMEFLRNALFVFIIGV